VLNAREGGPAWKSGIRGTSRDDYGRLVLGDIITAINGAKVRNSSDLYRLLDKATVRRCVFWGFEGAGKGGRCSGGGVDARPRPSTSTACACRHTFPDTHTRAHTRLCWLHGQVGDALDIEILRGDAKQHLAVVLEANT
jgi:hypothetical protein